MRPDRPLPPCVVLTRPEGRNEALSQRLQQGGFSTLLIPALRIQPLAVDSHAFARPAAYDLVMFVSGQAVKLYMDTLATVDEFQWPANTRAAAVGSSTAQLLASRYAVPDSALLYPGPVSGNDSEALWQLVQPLLAGIGRVLIVRGQQGRNWFHQQLAAAGVHVDTLELYARIAQPISPHAVRALKHQLYQPCRPIVLLTSSQSVQAMADQMRSAGLLHAWLNSRFLAIHSRVAAQLQSVAHDAGMAHKPMVKLCSPNDDAIFQAIVAMASFPERS